MENGNLHKIFNFGVLVDTVVHSSRNVYDGAFLKNVSLSFRMGDRTYSVISGTLSNRHSLHFSLIRFLVEKVSSSVYPLQLI